MKIQVKWMFCWIWWCKILHRFELNLNLIIKLTQLSFISKNHFKIQSLAQTWASKVLWGSAWDRFICNSRHDWSSTWLLYLLDAYDVWVDYVSELCCFLLSYYLWTKLPILACWLILDRAIIGSYLSCWWQGATWDPDGRMILLSFSKSSALGSIHFASKPPSLGTWNIFWLCGFHLFDVCNCISWT